MFIQNAWYPVAHSKEVGRKILARRICDEPLVMFRTQDGTPAILEDLCCHRLLPLSHGKLNGDNLVCGYHGMEFNAAGACVNIPCQERINPNAKVKSYPTVERHNFVWTWIGDESLADPDEIPDFSWNDSPDWRGDSDSMLLQCDYRLLIDNLLDLSHESYVHWRWEYEEIAKAPIKTTQDGETVTVSRVSGAMDYEEWSNWGNWMKRAIGYQGRFYRFQHCIFSKPCFVVIDSGAIKEGCAYPNNNPNESIRGKMINCAVPSTPTSCWHLFSWPRNYALDDHRLTADIIKILYDVFLEDVEVLEAQQRSILENPDRSMVSIAVDAGPMKARRIIEQNLGEAKRAAE